MQTELIKKENVSASFRVTVPQDVVDKTYEQVFRSLSRQIKVPGFRPGKAPRGVILKRIGEDALNQEVREALVDQHYSKAVQELELQPVHANIAKADEPNQGSDYSFEVDVDLFPEFELADLDEIIIDAAAQPLTEEMVQESIEQLRGEHATHIPVDRAVEAGDYLMIETIQDDAAEDTPGNAMPIDLDRTGEHLAAQLLGKSIGDVVELDLSGGETEGSDEGSSDPDDADAVNGEAVEAADADAEEANDIALPKFKVKITDVKEKEKPETDDEFAKTLGLETWAQVEETIRNNIQSELDNEAFENQREEFIDKLVEETTVDLPAYLVNRRKVNLIENLAEDLKKQNGLTLDAYLESLDADGKREEFDAELTESAEKGVKRDIVLERLLEKRGTRMTNQDFESAIAYMAHRENTPVTKFKKERGESWLENYRFLLTRDKAIREIVREKLKLDDTDDKDEVAEAIADEVEVEEAQDSED